LNNDVLKLTLIGTFGLKDPLRERVNSCVKYAKEHAKLCVRLVSGDHMSTAHAVALTTGILQPEEAGKDFACMSGDKFRQAFVIPDQPPVMNEKGEYEVDATFM
jgi:magnesium-transporting ATPase (P-type)